MTTPLIRAARTLMRHDDLDPDVFVGINGGYGHYLDGAQAIIEAANQMDDDCAQSLKREFGYVPQERDGEKWVVYKDHTLLVIHPERRARMYRRGGFGADNYIEIEAPW